MKLQGAIFDLSHTLTDQEGHPLPGLEPFLTLMKLEDVEIYLVTQGSRSQAQETLAQARLAGYFKGILSAPEQGRAMDDPELYRKAARRMDTAPKVTAVFTARASLLPALQEAGFYTVLVGQPSGDGHKPDMAILDYREMSSGGLG